ncbi:MAG: PE-PPE domain-containing protein [Candidatus Sericytochromatia bacterium]
MALIAVVVVVIASSTSLVVRLAATTALIMGGSGIGNPTVLTDAGIHVPIPNYIPNVETYYIAPNTTCDVATCRLVPVVTPEGLLPPLIGSTTFDPSVAEGVVDLNNALQTQLAQHPGEPVVIFGYSQSSDIATIVKANLASDPTAPPPDQLSFALIGNTNRPNGGIFTRFPGVHIPILNITFNGPPTPTNTGYKTTDIAFQYDPVADFPQYPINILADLNALAGFLGVHATYPNPFLPLPAGIPFFPTGLPGGYTPAQLQQLMNDPANRQTYGDTTYITIPPNNLPLLQPLVDIGAATGLSALTTPIVDLIQPAMRVLIELGYDRTIPYGQPTPAGLFPTIDPTKLATGLAAAVGQGIQAALTDLATHATSPATSQAAQLAASAAISTADNPAATTPKVAPLPQAQPSSTSPTPAPLLATTATPKTVLRSASAVDGAAQTATAADQSGQPTRNNTVAASKRTTPMMPSTTTSTSEAPSAVAAARTTVAAPATPHSSTTPKNRAAAPKDIPPAPKARKPSATATHTRTGATNTTRAAR